MNPSSAECSSQRKNLSLLVWVRSIAIVMQCLAIGLAVYGFKLALPLAALAVVIAAEIILNILSVYRLRQLAASGQALSAHELLSQLLADVLALALLLYLTGGGVNPFTGLFIVPVILAATLLNQGQTWLLVVLSIASYCVLAFMPSEHAHHMGGVNSLFDVHRYGMLLGFVVSALLITVFVSRVVANLAERDAQLFKINQQAEASRQINALGMLAAGAAHDLGTPLNSLSLIESELRSALTPDVSTTGLLNMHAKQLARAKRSLNDLMSVTGESRAENASPVLLADFFKQLCARWQEANAQVQLNVSVTLAETASAPADTLFEKALVNLLDNAAKVSPNHVAVNISYASNILKLCVSDKGPGICDEVIASLNEPAGLSLQQFGFGLFWVNAFATRMSGSLQFEKPASGGTKVSLSLPLVVSHHA